MTSRRDALRPTGKADGRPVCVCAVPASTFPAAFFAFIPLSGAKAQSARLFAEFTPDLEVYGVALSFGLALFSAFLALAYISERKSWRRREIELGDKLEQTRAQRDRAEIFLSADQQVFVAWDGPSGEPDIEGSPQLLVDASSPRRFLAFGSWLTPPDAVELERGVERLRTRGESFHLPLFGLTGRHYDADGRAVGGRAVLRLREVSGDRLELLGLRERYAEGSAYIEGLHGLLDALPAPVWLRGRDGRLFFVNQAYAQAVEAKDPVDALARQVELLDETARVATAEARAKGAPWREQVNAVVAGARHLLEVIQTPFVRGAAAIAFDRQEIQTMRADFQKQKDSHTRTLDQMPTAVAIFDGAQQLIYRNAAYDKLWRLDAGFLDQRPTDGEILDRLRLEQRLPVEGEFRSWKARILEAYRSPEQVQHVWHLPDGKTTICVTMTPNPNGGVTYLYDDMSERYDLESRFNTLYRTQSETLQSLREGVAVFGADGRLKFGNPAFASLWRLAPEFLGEKPHFETIVERCRQLHPTAATWSDLRGVVTGLPDARLGLTRRLERSDGAVLDLTAQPLPEGASLLTFVDVTADVNVERALTDRNKALLAAEKLRNDFIHHVSYELRSPLTNINGFVHLLGEESTGELNERQREYLGYMRKSSDALRAIVDDILDLATIDENALALEVEEVDARAAMRAAVEGVQDRIAEHQIELRIVAPDDIGTFRGDAKRVRQILFNLLSNAVGFSRSGQTVTLAAMRRDGGVVFKVVDNGRGIPPEILERVFDRFESHTSGSRHRGVGLGLSIVKAFMDLHGGKILIDSAVGEGTTVTCIFPGPAEAAAPQKALERLDATPLMNSIAEAAAEALERKGVKLRLLPANRPASLMGVESELREAFLDLILAGADEVGQGQAMNFAGILRKEEIVLKLSYRGGGGAAEGESAAAARALIEGNGGKMQRDALAGEAVTVTCVFPLAQGEEVLDRDDAL